MKERGSMCDGGVEKEMKEEGEIKMLTESFCLHKHLGSTSAPINNTPQISRLDRRRGLLETCPCMCVCVCVCVCELVCCKQGVFP